MNSPAFIPAATTGTWPARLELQVGRRGGSSRLQRCHHRGPLYVQRAFYPEGEDLAHLYLLHPPGGVVSGDALQIRVQCREQSRALITTPGAGRIYRARDTLPLQQQAVHLQVEAGASLEWFPLETIVYDGACVEMTTDIQLAENSHFIGWEVTCFGLPASGAPFTKGSFRQRYRVHQHGVPLFVDGFEVADGSREALLQGSAALRGSPVSGFFLAGPLTDSAIDDDIMASLRAGTTAGETLAISLVGTMLVGRYLGASAEGARRRFTGWWEIVRPLLLQREASAPRIWLT